VISGAIMETTVYIKRDNQPPVPVKLRTVRNNGQWLAVAEILTKSGPVKLTAMASEQTVADLVRRGVAKIPSGMIAGADIFSSIAKLTQSQAAQGVLKQAQSVIKNPLFMSALSFIPGFGPAVASISKATSAVKAAENLMGRARQGDPKAQKSVSVIANSAKKGSKKGSILLALLQAADGIRKTFFSGDATEVNDMTAQFGYGDGANAGWSPPWGSPSSGNSWTPPWGGSNPPQQLPSSAVPNRPAAPPGWPQMPPPQSLPYDPRQMREVRPPGSPYTMLMPEGWMPTPVMTPNPNSYPYPWPWFPRSTPKC
jgi:hypothetical protein